jgi:succinylarginine dihydrolase
MTTKGLVLAFEANFDGLVGLTHNYGGLSAGNLASAANATAVSRPKEGALQGLAKAKRLADAGLVQGLLPPHERPHLPTLKAIGFSGSDGEILAQAWKADPALVRNVSSSAQMWAANAATVSPSADCSDGRLHFSPANLLTMPHRALEASQTERSLRAIFADTNHFAVHKALPYQPLFADEGAANHMRLCANHGEAGVEIFVWGRNGFGQPETRFPARQTLQTGEAIARRHGLASERVLHLQQSRKAIEAGAFHNDVVAVASLQVLFCHEHAFEDRLGAYEAIKRACDGLMEVAIVEVPEADVPLADAIKSYLFNTQLLSMPGEDRLVLIAPEECRENAATNAYLEKLVASNGPIGRVQFVDVRQSMRNGGGPACLRLRVVLDDAKLQAVSARAVLDAALYEDLVAWVNRHYRETLGPDDLADPSLLNEGRTALDELTQIMRLGSDFYPFQRD